MSIKRFTLTNPKNIFQEMKCGIDDRGNTLTFNEVVDLLNEQHEENEELRKAVDNCQFRTLDLLDYIKEKKTVTHQEIKDWWNSEVMK